NAGPAERNDVIFGRNFFLDATVEIFVLEKEHRIVVSYRSFDQPLGIIGTCRTDHFQPGRVHKPHLGILRVKRTPMDVAPAGAADDEWRRRAPAVMGLSDHIDDLVECAANEVHKLKFGDGTHASERCSECGANDGGLSDGSINYAFRTEVVDETISDFKRPTVDANVLSQAENGRVSFHFFPDALAD